ncbi:hypothetical protein CRG98_029139 [Punica granatum]|uniref:Uncharacterized protein n=1 Tax=Punica granatum TaxID=22663 RepID=A0A2I0J3Z6_PUNGR|nr:hypothetical protein CRG98_029139 [Punica granatum]
MAAPRSLRRDIFARVQLSKKGWGLWRSPRLVPVPSKIWNPMSSRELGWFEGDGALTGDTTSRLSPLAGSKPIGQLGQWMGSPARAPLLMQCGSRFLKPKSEFRLEWSKTRLNPSVC